MLKDFLNKSILIFLFFSCATSFKKQEIGFGKATKSSIEDNKLNQKRISCSDSSELDLIYQNSSNSKYKISGTKDNFSLAKLLSETPKKKFLKPNCKSLKNDFEECFCEYDEKSSILKESFFGFISDSRYRKISLGKSNKDLNDLFKKKYSCIESAKLNSISSAIFELNESVDFSFNSPEIYIAECKSADLFETCSCDILLYKTDLKKTLSSK